MNKINLKKILTEIATTSLQVKTSNFIDESTEDKIEIEYVSCENTYTLKIIDENDKEIYQRYCIHLEQLIDFKVAIDALIELTKGIYKKEEKRWEKLEKAKEEKKK